MLVTDSGASSLFTRAYAAPKPPEPSPSHAAPPAHSSAAPRQYWPRNSSVRSPSTPTSGGGAPSIPRTITTATTPSTRPSAITGSAIRPQRLGRNFAPAHAAAKAKPPAASAAAAPADRVSDTTTSPAAAASTPATGIQAPARPRAHASGTAASAATASPAATVPSTFAKPKGPVASSMRSRRSYSRAAAPPGSSEPGPAHVPAATAAS